MSGSWHAQLPDRGRRGASGLRALPEPLAPRGSGPPPDAATAPGRARRSARRRHPPGVSPPRAPGPPGCTRRPSDPAHEPDGRAPGGADPGSGSAATSACAHVATYARVVNPPGPLAIATPLPREASWEGRGPSKRSPAGPRAGRAGSIDTARVTIPGLVVNGRRGMNPGVRAPAGQAPAASRTAATIAGTTWWRSPITAQSACARIGASGSLLITSRRFAPRQPTMCWVAPLMPQAM